MYLKAIEITGFKSFADKMRFDLQQGITCVIGPNGCGKSNVVDSIRWCIGEMSWKSLRTASMVDIIFNGTKNRPPLNMAEVNMIFDNQSRRLHIDFSEVTVTRRIFRSGESEYYLNKTQCRLRDIRDLFLDTGIGGEGYAIIDQGGVDFVLSSTPETRRELFEEAAGVSKYKAKRDEAQKRLEKVDQDLGRLMDSVVLIEEQIKKLDSEARKARLYQKYREELRDAEMAMMLETISVHNTEIEKSRSELEPLGEKISVLSNNVDMLDGEIAALNLNLTHKQSEVAQVSQKVADTKYQVGLLEGNIRECDNMSAELTRQIKSGEEEDALSNARLSELEPAVSRIRSEMTALEEAITPLKNRHDSTAKPVSDSEQEGHRLLNEIEQANSESLKAAQNEMLCNNDISLTSSGVSHDQENILANEKESERETAALSALKAELDSLRQSLTAQNAEVERLKAESSALEARKADAVRRSAELAQALSNRRSEKAALTATLEMLRAQGQKDPYWVGTQAALESGIPGVKGTLRRLITIPPAMKLAAEDALGKFIDAVVCENAQAAEAASSAIKAKGNARARLVMLDKVAADATSAPSALLDAIQRPAEIDSLLKQLLSGVQTAEGSVSGPFWLCAGAENVESPEAYWGQEGEVEERLAAASRDEETINAGLSAAQADLSETEGLIGQTREALNTELVRLNTLGNTISAKETAVKNAEETVSLIENERGQLLAQKQEKEKRLEELKTQLETLRQTKENKLREIEELKIERNRLSEETAFRRKDLERLALELGEMRIKRGSLEADLRGVENERSALTESLRRREEDRRQAQARLDKFAQEKQAAETNLETGRGELARLEIGESELRHSLDSIRTEFETKNKAANESRQQLNSLQMTAHDLEGKLNTHTSQRDHVVNKLFEEWQVTPEEARVKAGDQPVDHERVKMMRRRLENMGNINMTAPEEYDALNARLTFLRTQIGDLEQAKADLKAAISKINSTTRENFRHTYDLVREHFRRIYQSLFVGGEADLVLTNPEDLLTTGVDIMAQPPGKKLQNIASLSGGEKALTALSLLFSFFCVNPSPFCIMDEADAPLDEANVERFTRLLQEFGSQTQFIVITHNKRTMEAAGIMYGVTMEENGVSKVMSVELKKKTAELQHSEPAVTLTRN